MTERSKSKKFYEESRARRETLLTTVKVPDADALAGLVLDAEKDHANKADSLVEKARHLARSGPTPSCGS